ncbi:MAG: radical SAM family heme chaperone HemW, partial [Lachnospiraceae bacterium]|nr:radical SAM family heme chaperone HemW [Lachnospiraceae bacterium]
MEIYVHIPFCVRKCAYCDFYSLPDARSMEEEYFKALKEEITEWGLKCRETGRTDVSSVFFGGGTPSCADPRHISETMALLRRYFSLREDAEITLEANPGTLDKKKLETYKQAGINRLSLGLQSADDVMLEKLGRIHRFRDFEKSYYLARETGFRNISVDLMSGLPGETETGFINSLKTVLSFEPEHLSVYSLIIAENTPFYALYGPEGTKTEELPGEDTDRRIVSRTREILEASGYRQYEISNYAKPGFASRHNIGYWTGEEYLGFGAAAASFLYTKIGNAGRRSPVTETGSTVEAKTKVDTSPGFGSV